MRVELDSIAVPHRKLPLLVAAVAPPTPGIPGPDLVRVQKIQLPLEFAARELPQVAFEIAVDVVRMILVLCERAVDENLRDADLPELFDQNREVEDQFAPQSSSHSG